MGLQGAAVAPAALPHCFCPARPSCTSDCLKDNPECVYEILKKNFGACWLQASLLRRQRRRRLVTSNPTLNSDPSPISSTQISRTKATERRCRYSFTRFGFSSGVWSTSSTGFWVSKGRRHHGCSHSAGRRGAPSRSLKPATARCPCPGRPVDYALEQDNVWAISLQQLLAWMQNPIPASEITPEKLGCGNPGGAGPSADGGHGSSSTDDGAGASADDTHSSASADDTHSGASADDKRNSSPSADDKHSSPSAADGIVDGSTRRFEKDWP